MPRILIGLIGAPNSGRKIVGQHLVDSYGFARVRFGDAIDRMLRVLGADDEHLSGTGMHQPIYELGGRSFQYAKQALGYHFGRRMMSENLWVHPWRRAIEKVAGNIVVDDIRFNNEAEAVRAAGGVIVRVERPTKPGVINQTMRVMMQIRPDAVLFNSGTTDELIRMVDQELGQIFQPQSGVANG